MHPPRPWYKEFWPWFLLAILAFAVVMGTTTLVLSITSFDGLVEDDYYKVGLAINETLEEEQRAKALGLSADLRIDDLTGDVVIDLSGASRPERLRLDMIFPTQNKHDRHVILERIREGHYTGQLPQALNNRWYVHLTPDTPSPEWRLQGEIELPRQSPLTLGANRDAP